MLVRSTISPSLKVGLRLLGVWPGVHSTVYWLICVSSILILQCFQYLYVFAHFRLSELSILADSLPVTLDYTLRILKLTNLWIHRRIIQEILITMDNDWRESINVDQHLYVMTIKANKSHFYSNAMLSFNIIAAALYLLGDYALRAVHVIGDDNDTSWQFPIKIQVPFETEQSPIFELLVITLSLHLMSSSVTVAILNGFIFSLVLHVSGQIDIICQELKTISEKTRLYESSMSKLGMLIARHNRVISFSDNIEELLSFFALMQIVWSILVICCLGFMIIISLYNEASLFIIVKAFLAYTSIMIENFILCFAGEYLSLKSKSIADAAYDSLWYDLPTNQNKIILFIIMRGQMRLTITAGKFANLSIETFANIMKASASYISVFYTIY